MAICGSVGWGGLRGLSNNSPKPPMPVSQKFTRLGANICNIVSDGGLRSPYPVLTVYTGLLTNCTPHVLKTILYANLAFIFCRLGAKYTDTS